MRANPGGEIAPQDVVGRDRLIARLWQTLERQSVILVAERRMGKSCVVKKMEAEETGSHLMFYRDVEGIGTPIEFAEQVYHVVEGHLSLAGKAAGRVRALVKQLAGFELGSLVKLPKEVASHWKNVLERTIEDLAEHQKRPVVFFWDELPLMLKKITQSAGEETAMEMLDTLRGLRQMHGNLRMVYTGSIGLHHVTSALAVAGHANDATNDMRTVEVPELEPEDAELLAKELLLGEELACDDLAGTARTIAREVDFIPFYIHSVVSSMKDRGDTATAELARQIVAGALVDPQDAWHLQHYRKRLNQYYGEDRLPVILTLLDDLAAADEPLSFDQIRSRLGANLQPDASDTARRVLSEDAELLRDLLVLLQRDHYVQQQSEDGRYRFRFLLIRRWWRLSRSLP
jgi:hypothetical protein